MKIGMVLDTNFPPDIRVEKEARALLSAGHEVHLLAYARSGGSEPSDGTVEGLRVHRVPKLPKLQRRWNLLSFYLTFHNSYWATQIQRYVRDFNLDVLHVHDLPLVGTAISVARAQNLPVIADLHENYPAALQVWRKATYDPKAWFVANLRRWTAYEKRMTKHASHVIVVVDEAQQRLIEQHNTSAEKITVLMNVEDVDRSQGIPLNQEIISRYQDDFTISYIGGGGSHRGLDTAVQAMTYLRNLPRLKLLLIGLRDPERRFLQSLALTEGVADLIEIHGWQPFNEVPSYIQASKICLVPHHQNAHTDSTIPHKLFQYMFMNRAVIVSSCQPLRRIVEETQSGLVFQAGDYQDLAEKIRTLYENKQLRQDCGRLGGKAILNKYNWAQESSKLCLLYDSLVKKIIMIKYLNLL